MIATVLHTVRQGGWIMWPIISVSFVVWWLGLWKLYTLWNLGRSRLRFLSHWDGGKSAPRSTGNTQYDLLLRKRSDGDFTGGSFRAVFREFLMVTLSSMNSGLTTIGVWIAVAPLLGLLGTVVGMIETFRVITVFGAGNPALTAEGISIALLTTEAGLTVAFPGMLLHAFIGNWKNRLQHQLLADGERIYLQLTKSA